MVGITIGEHAKAFYYKTVAEQSVVNDFVGPYPVAIYVEEKTRNVHVYLRQVDDQVVTLSLDEAGQCLIDNETGTTWTFAQGLAQEGELKGQALLHVPYLSSFDWAWLDFHPNSEFYR